MGTGIVVIVKRLDTDNMLGIASKLNSFGNDDPRTSDIGTVNTFNAVFARVVEQMAHGKTLKLDNARLLEAHAFTEAHRRFPTQVVVDNGPQDGAFEIVEHAIVSVTPKNAVKFILFMEPP